MKKSTNGFKFQKEVKTNFTKVPNEIFGLKLNIYQKLILIYLHSKADYFIYYHQVIADDLGITRQTVSKTLKELVEQGLIRSEDGGKSYSIMLTGLTSNVNEGNINNVNLVTNGVNLVTEKVTELTSNVNEVNTNKKTEIIRLNNKSKINSAPLPQPTPLGATVVSGADLVIENDNNPANMNANIVSQVLDYFDNNPTTLIQFNSLSFKIQIQMLDQLNVRDYDEQLNIISLAKKKGIYFNQEPTSSKSNDNNAPTNNLNRLEAQPVTQVERTEEKQFEVQSTSASNYYTSNEIINNSSNNTVNGHSQPTYVPPTKGELEYEWY